MKTVFRMARYQLFVSSLFLGLIFLTVAFCDVSLFSQPWKSRGNDPWVQLNPFLNYFYGRGYLLFGGSVFSFWSAALMFLLPGKLFAGKGTPPGILLHYFRRENIGWRARPSLGIFKGSAQK